MAARLTLHNTSAKKVERVGKGVKVSKKATSRSRPSKAPRKSTFKSRERSDSSEETSSAVDSSASSSSSGATLSDSTDDSEIEIISGKKALNRKKAAKFAKKMDELSALDDGVLDEAKRMNLKSVCRGSKVHVPEFDFVQASELRAELKALKKKAEKKRA